VVISNKSIKDDNKKISNLKETYTGLWLCFLVDKLYRKRG